MNLILLGAPGSGKGTLAKDILPKYPLFYLSTGDLLRSAVEKQTQLGVQAQQAMQSGELVSDDLVIALIGENLEKASTDKGYLLDGFPRNFKQAQAFDRYLAEHPQWQVDHVIYLEAGIEIILERLTARRVCSECGTIYNLKNHPPKKEGICDREGAPLKTRADDQSDTIRHRFEVFQKETLPLIEYYQKQGKLSKIPGELSDQEAFQAFEKLGVLA